MDRYICPQCGSDELEFQSEEIARQTRYEPAAFLHFARCLDCLWDGDPDDLISAPCSEKAAENFLDEVIEEMGNSICGRRGNLSPLRKG